MEHKTYLPIGETVPTEQGENGVRHIWSTLETGKSDWTSQKEKKSKLSSNVRQAVHEIRLGNKTYIFVSLFVSASMLKM